MSALGPANRASPAVYLARYRGHMAGERGLVELAADSGLDRAIGADEDRHGQAERPVKRSHAPLEVVAGDRRSHSQALEQVVTAAGVVPIVDQQELDGRGSLCIGLQQGQLL